jgi:hypothetical protein
MAPVPDPYQTLGLARGASLDDVKRAYRRLAKEHHPDSGGERALPRFLEIQAAYEQLIVASGRTGRGGASATAARAGSAPWQADDLRADATRRAYGSRTRRPGGRAGPSGRPSGSPPRPSTGAGGPSAAPGQEPADAESRRRRPPRRDRPANKATFGSTTYDGADGEPFEPDWTGASWYGTSSGTYWTLNPREYADPRKHGPEYQARARRARAEAQARGEVIEDDDAPDLDPDLDPGGAEPPAPDASATDDPDVSADTRTAGSWWTAPRRGDVPRPGTEPGDRRSARERIDTADPDVPLDPLGAATGYVRRLVDDPPTGPGARFVTAVVGGSPLALALAWLLGELTGCGRFSATCDPVLVAFAWPAGLALIAVLALVPRIASLATVGSVGLVIAGIPTTIFLTATGGSRVPDASGALLGAVLAVAWVAAFGYAAVRRRRLGGVRRHVS